MSLSQSQSLSQSLSLSASMFDERLTTAAMDRSMLLQLLLLLLLQPDTRRGTVPICENLNLKFLFIYTHRQTHTLTHTHTFTHSHMYWKKVGKSVKSEKLRGKWINLLFKQMKCRQFRQLTNRQTYPVHPLLPYPTPSLANPFRMRTFSFFICKTIYN